MTTRRVTTRGTGIDGLLSGCRVEEVASFTAREQVSGPTRFRWWCLILVTAGTGRIRWDQGPWQSLPAGSYVQTRPGDLAQYGPAGTAFDHVYVSLSGAGVEDLGRCGLLPAGRLVHGGADVDAVPAAIDRLHGLLAQRRPRAQDDAWIAAKALLLELLYGRQTQQRLPRAVAALLARLEADPMAEYDLAAFARQQGISLPHLRASFRAATGHAPGVWQNFLRCDLAKRLLRDPQLSVQAVGERVGLSHPVSFSRFFRRLVGQSPRDWRRDQL